MIAHFLESNVRGCSRLWVDSYTVDTDVSPILAALEHNTTVHVLRFSTILFEADDFVALARLLSPATSIIKSLQIDDVRIVSRDLAVLCDALAQNNVLETLHLGSNNISSRGALHLGRLFQENKRITSFWLSGSHIGNDGANLLFSGLAQNSTLRSLRLWGSAFRDISASIIADYLKQNQILSTFELAIQDLSVDGMLVIANALGTNHTLKDLRYDIARDISILPQEELNNAFIHVLNSNLTLTNVKHRHQNPKPLRQLLARNKCLIIAARHSCLFLIGIRRSTNFEGMGDFAVFPKDIVRLIAQTVWATRKDPIWIQAIPDPGAAGEQH